MLNFAEWNCASIAYITSGCQVVLNNAFSIQLQDGFLLNIGYKCLFHHELRIFLLFILFLNYNTIKNYILITYELSNIIHVLHVVPQIGVSVGQRILILLINHPTVVEYIIERKYFFFLWIRIKFSNLMLHLRLKFV